MTDYLLRLAQVHESFRLPEVKALAELAGITLDVIQYRATSPFCILHLGSEDAARTLVARSILSNAIYELWGSGPTYELLHPVVRHCGHNNERHRQKPFKFMIDSFQGKRDPRKQRDLFNSFRYLHFQGPVDMLNPELEMCVFEDFERESPEPHEIHFGRFIASSGRHAVAKHDLKKRRYISKTSMEAELSLVAANISLAAPNKLFYDPFVGTGSFAVTCAHFGTMFLGSDIDGRSIRGTQDRNLLANFTQYDLRDLYLDSFIADVVHCPLRNLQIFDGIICDPPYGVREGPRVLGLREGKKARNVSINGVPAHQREGYIPPKKPYSFEDMVQDLFELAFAILKDHGTLSMWLPMANEEEATAVLPHHSGFDLSSCCVQRFNKWSRRLATYRRKRNTASRASVPSNRPFALGNTANDLNRFRKRYFQGFANSVVC